MTFVVTTPNAVHWVMITYSAKKKKSETYHSAPTSTAISFHGQLRRGHSKSGFCVLNLQKSWKFIPQAQPISEKINV